MINAVCMTAWRTKTGLSRGTIYRWRKEGWFALLKLNGRLYIPESTLLEFERRFVLVPVPRDRDGLHAPGKLVEGSLRDVKPAIKTK